MLFSEPKIPQSNDDRVGTCDEGRFSALQRAENSSIGIVAESLFVILGFSALQRAENSSIQSCAALDRRLARVSVLFSEPKIPQFARFAAPLRLPAPVSVLFSEPKIPQLALVGDK